MFFPAPEPASAPEFDPGPAKEVCKICSVATECLQFAVASKAASGVWGGFNFGSVAERRFARKWARDRAAAEQQRRRDRRVSAGAQHLRR